MSASGIFIPISLAKSKALEEDDQLCELIQTLHDELHLAKFFFDEDHVNHGRAGIIGALGAVCEFIEGFDDFQADQLTRPLRSLQGGLIDAMNGTRNPVLEPAKFARRPPSSQDKQRLRTYAAVAMTLFMKSGRSKDQAAFEVANILNQAGYKLDGRADKSSIRPITIAKWRDRVMGGLPDEDNDTNSYRFLFSNFSPHILNEKKAAEAAAFSVLAIIPSVIRPNNP